MPDRMKLSKWVNCARCPRPIPRPEQDTLCPSCKHEYEAEHFAAKNRAANAKRDGDLKDVVDVEAQWLN